MARRRVNYPKSRRMKVAVYAYQYRGRTIWLHRLRPMQTQHGKTIHPWGAEIEENGSTVAAVVARTRPLALTHAKRVVASWGAMAR